MLRLSITVALAIFGPSASSALATTKKSRSQVELGNIACAMQCYQGEYGGYPVGKSLEVIKMLQGDNPNRVVFLEWNPRSTNYNGRLLDEWGTPYLIFAKRDRYAVRSAGPDRQFETADDRFIEEGPVISKFQILH